jgi:hypothetical protein
MARKEQAPPVVDQSGGAVTLLLCLSSQSEEFVTCTGWQCGFYAGESQTDLTCPKVVSSKVSKGS